MKKINLFTDNYSDRIGSYAEMLPVFKKIKIPSKIYKKFSECKEILMSSDNVYDDAIREYKVLIRFNYEVSNKVRIKLFHPVLAKQNSDYIYIKDEYSKKRWETVEKIAFDIDIKNSDNIIKRMLRDKTVTHIAGINTMPSVVKKLIISWPFISKSPYSNSFYNTPGKSWDFTPPGSLRVADHWNFYSRETYHCLTDKPVENNTEWALGQWDEKQYHYKILKTWPLDARYMAKQKANEKARLLALKKAEAISQKHIKTFASDFRKGLVEAIITKRDYIRKNGKYILNSETDNQGKLIALSDTMATISNGTKGTDFRLINSKTTKAYQISNYDAKQIIDTLKKEKSLSGYNQQIIYVDGTDHSCGLYYNGIEFYFPRKYSTTNNDNEILAILIGIKYALYNGFPNVLIRSDSQIALTIAESGHSRKKHLAGKGWLIQKFIDIAREHDYAIEMEWIPGKENLADDASRGKGNVQIGWSEPFQKLELEDIGRTTPEIKNKPETEIHISDTPQNEKNNINLLALEFEALELELKLL